MSQNRKPNKLKARLNLLFNNVKLCFYEKDGKKYLAIVKTNWKGVKWSRHFEIVKEVKT